jgi:murein DD-endopeptidase MepM/ murein hydrolase activator NlpD
MEKAVEKQYKPEWPVAPLCVFRERDTYGPNKRWDKDKQQSRPHWGIDIYRDRGTGVMASLDGVVFRAFDVDYGAYGKSVIIDHTAEGQKTVDEKKVDSYCYIYTLYAHLDRAYSYLLGQKVRKGDIIGTVGNTGNAKDMPPHLHFETIISNAKLTWNATGNTGQIAGHMRVDPQLFLNGIVCR